MTSLALYIGFLLFDSAWTLQLPRAVDWVGGALVLVGPVIAAFSARHTQDVLAVAEEGGWGRTAPWRRTAVTMGTFAAAHVLAHCAILGAAVAFSWATGGRGSLMPGAATRQLVAVVTFAAIGHLAGRVARTRVMPALVAVVMFLLPWYFYVASNLSPLFIYTGGSPDVPRGALDHWPALGAQIALWSGISLVAVTLSAMRPTTRPIRVIVPCALAAGLALTGGTFVSRSDGEGYAYPSQMTVECQGDDLQLCLTSESERARGRLTSLAASVREAIVVIGVSPQLIQRVVEADPGHRPVVDGQGEPLDGNGNVRVSISTPMLQGPPGDEAFVGALISGSHCDDAARWDTFEGEYWIRGQLGLETEDDVVEIIEQLGEEGREWLRTVFTGALTCAPGSPPDFPVTW